MVPLDQIKQIINKDDNAVKQLVIKFDNLDVGKQLRKSQQLQDNDPTHIGRISLSYSLGNIKKDMLQQQK